MSKEMFLRLGMLQYAGWCMHPGYRGGKVTPPTPGEFYKLLEDIWDTSQLSLI